MALLMLEYLVVLVVALVGVVLQSGREHKQTLVVEQVTEMMVVAEETMPLLPVAVEQAQ